MPVLSTLRKQVRGEWISLADFLQEAYRRETSALAALAAALSAPPEEQKELTQGEGAAVLLEVARDLRVPKASRLAAARCLLEAGLPPQSLGELFSGAGDLVNDPRLGGAARKLVEGGLPAALAGGGDAAQVSLAAGAFARSAQVASSAVGQDRAKDLLAAAPQGHAGAAAALFALGLSELPPGQLEAWKKLLAETCGAHRRAPAAAKRMGPAPPWPPNLPEAFAPLIEEAEKANQGVVAADAAAGASVAALKGAAGAAAPPAPPGPPRSPARSSSEVVGTKTMAPIRKSPFRKAIGSVMEVPTRVPAKPMEELKGRANASSLPPPPKPAHPRMPEKGEGVPPKAFPLPGLRTLPSSKGYQTRYDPTGKRIPRNDRWRDDAFEWEEPVLPSSELPKPMKVQALPGPFAPRLKSLFDNRPEAVDRLLAAAEARVALAGEEKVLEELSKESSRKEWAAARLPREQHARLQAIEADSALPTPWRAVARFLLDRLTPA